MAFQLTPGRSILRELRRIVRKETRRAAKSLIDDGETEVHAARKSVKKARAIVQLLGEKHAKRFEKDEKRLRTAGRALSALRDADAVLATFDQLRKRYPNRLAEHTYAVVRRQLVRAKARVIRTARAEQALAGAARTLRKVGRSAKQWPMPSIDRSEWPALLEISFRATRKAMRQAEQRRSPEDVHRWRKRLKTLWYQVRLAESLAPRLGAEIRQAKQLETWLGDAHNLHVLQGIISHDPALRQLPRDVRELTTIAAASEEALVRKAFALGKRLHGGKPKTFSGRVRRALTASGRRRSSRSSRPSSAAA
jgi:CHAD domain-containing protein